MIVGIFAFIFLLAVLVLVHELGHYAVARIAGVAVDVFSVGFGRELIGRTDSHGTRWRISLLPLGGYVKMRGDDLFEATQEKGALTAQSRIKRTAIVMAGPMANLLFAALILAVIFMSLGRMESPSARINKVVPHSAASKAGLRSGDLIVAINGRSVSRFQEVALKVIQGKGRPLKVTVRRFGVLKEVYVTPRALPTDPVTYQVGISSFPPQRVRVGFFSALYQGGVSVVSISWSLLQGLWKLVTAQVGLSALHGPVGIAKMTYVATSSGFLSFVGLAVLLSVNLGVINLLPIPLLDGGHLLFLLLDFMFGSSVAQKFYSVGLRLGVALLLFVMAFTTFNDVFGGTS